MWKPVVKIRASSYAGAQLCYAALHLAVIPTRSDIIPKELYHPVIITVIMPTVVTFRAFIHKRIIVIVFTMVVTFTYH